MGYDAPTHTVQFLSFSEKLFLREELLGTGHHGRPSRIRSSGLRANPAHTRLGVFCLCFLSFHCQASNLTSSPTSSLRRSPWACPLQNQFSLLLHVPSRVVSGAHLSRVSSHHSTRLWKNLNSHVETVTSSRVVVSIVSVKLFCDIYKVYEV